jgi:L-ascorbate metabolism protein UlaG (beta-lactamase superfamily)
VSPAQIVRAAGAGVQVVRRGKRRQSPAPRCRPSRLVATLAVIARRLTFAAAVTVVLVGVLACHPIRDPPVRSRPSAAAAAAEPDSIEVVWVGHATVLVRIADRWILTDPNFSERISWVVRRYVRPGVRLVDLPRLDWVLVSHAHPDHLDLPSLRQLPHGASLAVPPGVGQQLPRGLPFDHVDRLAAWDSVVREGVRVTAVPARHSNARWVLDGLWRRRAHTGFVVEYGPHVVYFAGDTGYDRELFREIGREFDIDVALVPVGPADRPGWVHRLRRHVHVSPSEALQIFEDVGAQWMVPVHFGTFFKRDAGELSAITDAIAAHERSNRVRMLQVGESETFYW